MSPPPPEERAPLNRRKVLRAAMDLADAEGLDGLSMRRLGKHVGVEAMSLYNHVANKDDLLRGIVDEVLGEIAVPTPGDDWREAMRARGTSARAVFRRHPWAVGLLEQHTEASSPRRLGYFDAVLGTLREAGFSAPLAIRAFNVMDSFIYGFILQEASLPLEDEAALEEVGTDLLEQMAGAYPHLAEATTHALAEGYDFATEFEASLDMLMDAIDLARQAEA